MKILLLFICLLIGYTSTSQEIDPELYGTWYLYFVMDTDLGTPYEVNEIDPPITPFITISENLEVEGEGACNTFNATYTYNANEGLYTNSFFGSTDKDCGFQVHNFFENSFFNFMSAEFFYEIIPDENGLTLRLSNLIFGIAIFKDYPLSVSENILEHFTIYPNPVSETLFISSESNKIEEVSIFSINGQLVLSKKNNIHQLDVSVLSNGLYFIKVALENGIAVQKLIKK